jgi:RTX calcium-binding nonapeptide repeat (4 copies)
MRAALVALGLALILPSAALAGQAGVRVEVPDPRAGDRVAVLVYDAAPGERNRVRVSLERRAFVVSDDARVTPGRGCRRIDAHRVRCPLPRAKDQSARIRLGDGDDTALADGVSSVLRGGAGADRLRVLGASAYFAGGPGRDHMTGGPSGDTFDEGGSSNGADTMLGAGGTDHVSYAGRRRPVIADLDGLRDDGERGERDLISADVHSLAGGRGADRLTGGLGDDALAGGRGRDTIAGWAGDDDLSAGTTADAIEYIPGADRLTGGAGNDDLLGSTGPDLLDGGAGYDALYGSLGADRLRARDGTTDLIECERGRPDRAMLDAFDWFAADGGCERPTRAGAAAGGAFLGYINSFGERRLQLDVRMGVATAMLGCAADGPRPCRGQIELLDGDRSLGGAAYRVPRGDGYQAVEIPLPPADAARADTVEGFPATLVIRAPDAAGTMREQRIRVLVRDDAALFR